MNRYYLTPLAAADVENIWDFVAQDSIDAAERVLDDIFRAMEALADMPGMGHVREDLANEALLVWPVHSYLIVYRSVRPDLEVVRVVSGFRDLFALFATD